MKKILVVDDSPTLRALLCAYLPKDGTYEVYEAEDGQSALALAVKTQPDICVLDYNLPDKNGIEIAQSIINAGIITQFILMTSDAETTVLDSAKTLGFAACIEKPLDQEAVLHALKSAL